MALGAATFVPALALDAVIVPGSDTKLKVYGFAMVYGEYYLNAGQPNNQWMSPLNDNARPDRQFQMSVQTSRLGFSTLTPAAGLGDIASTVEGDFNGGSYHIRHAFLNLANWTVGQTWSTWYDADASADTVDWAGPIGYPCADTPRYVQVRYTWRVDPRTSLDLGLEQGNGGGDGVKRNGAATGDGRYPTVVGAWTYADRWGHLGVRLLEQNITTYTPATPVAGSLRYGAWAGALQVSGSWLVGQDKVIACVYGGKGVGQYGYGAGPTGTEMPQQAATFNDATRTVNLYRSLGWTAGFTHHWTDKVRSNLVLSGLRFAENDAILNHASDLKDTGNLFLNTFVKLAKNVELGMEYGYEVARPFGPGNRVLRQDGGMTDKNVSHKFEVALTASF